MIWLTWLNVWNATGATTVCAPARHSINLTNGGYQPPDNDSLADLFVSDISSVVTFGTSIEWLGTLLPSISNLAIELLGNSGDKGATEKSNLGNGTSKSLHRVNYVGSWKELKSWMLHSLSLIPCGIIEILWTGIKTTDFGHDESFGFKNQSFLDILRRITKCGSKRKKLTKSQMRLRQ